MFDNENYVNDFYRSGTGTSITAEQAYTRCSVSTPGRCALVSD